MAFGGEVYSGAEGVEAIGCKPAAFNDVVSRVHIPLVGRVGRGRSPTQYHLIDVYSIAMFMALVSLMTDRTIRSDTAMTGEISLRGLVLPVGGIKEKVVAAHSAGIKRVMLPARNRRDYDDIPEIARREMEFVWLERVEEAVAAALEPKPAEKSPASVPQLADAEA